MKRMRLGFVGALALLAAATESFAEYAFVWANNPTAATYVPSATYQYNSNGFTNSVRRVRTGFYRVTMPSMQPAPSGNVQVSGYGDGSNYCKVGSWYQVVGTSDLTVDVYCFHRFGGAADSAFTVLYHDAGTTGENLAYAWLDRAVPTTYGHIPDAHYLHNAGPRDPAGDLWMHREGVGSYIVFIHGWPGVDRTFQVTAYDATSTRCNIRDQGHEEAFVTNGDYWIRRHYVRVACYTPAGVPADSRFTIGYARSRVFGDPRSLGAYTGSFFPSVVSSVGRLNFNPILPSSSAAIQRYAYGRYRVDLPGLSGTYSKSTVLVTAESSLSAHCKVASWGSNGADVRVSVDCYDSSGARRDSMFFLMFVTDNRF